MKNIIFCHDYVGEKLATWLLTNHVEDVTRLVCLSETPVTSLARDLGVIVSIYRSESALLEEFNKDNERLDLGFLLWGPKILSTRLLEICSNGFVNTHPSLLPFNRGKHTTFWAIVERCPFGVSLHYVDHGIDTGDILAQTEVVYDWEDTSETLYKRSREAMIQLFKDSYVQIRNSNLKAIPQDLDAGSFHYGSEIEVASRVDLYRSYRAIDLLNLLRARTFSGYPGCSFEYQGHRYELSLKIRRVDNDSP